MVGGHVAGPVEFVEHLWGQAVTPADGLDADVVVHEEAAFGDQVLDVEGHEGVDLVLGAGPVLGAEAVEGQGVEAEVDAVGDDGSNGFGTGLVAVGAVAPACGGPSAVAVHDDGDVARKR